MQLPPPLSWFWDAWMEFSKVLGRIMSAIILTILWLVGFSIYGIVLKIRGVFVKKKKKASYWIDLKKETGDGLKYQF